MRHRAIELGLESGAGDGMLKRMLKKYDGVMEAARQPIRLSTTMELWQMAKAKRRPLVTPPH